ncbi:MAG: hypothetical protein HGA42_02785, partial [Nostocales cyanobacterium W4_Combined_metabat2_030]|nr:hypothetical protein [Nostocales cyanobacterium W4_Combined_metabat2_030]
LLLDTKGRGLYKLGKYKEAMEILQKSWDLRMKNAIYDHSAFLHLEEARKAVVSGSFYPGNPESLIRMVNEFLNNAEKENPA